MYGLDLFSGIGGITKALADLVRPVAYCENDRYAQAVLLSCMATRDLPIAPIWDDVRTLHGDILPPVSIIYGGFPCQDISVAGRGKGLAGERSGLFFEVARLVGEIRPSFVFLENVPAIRTRGGDIVGEKLASLGYDCRWDIVSAAEIGAPHLRKRWFLLAHSSGSRLDEGKCGQSGTLRHKTRRKESQRLGSDVANDDGAGRTKFSGECSASRTYRSEIFDSKTWWAVEPKVDRVVDGLPQQLGQLKCLGNSVVPLQAREAFKRLAGVK